MISKSSISLIGQMRLAVGALFSVLLLLIGVSPAEAQQLKPLTVEQDPNGVDLLSGRVQQRMPTLAIPAAPRLSFNRISDWYLFLNGKLISQTNGSISFQINTLSNESESISCQDLEICGDNKQGGSAVMGDYFSNYYEFFKGGTGTRIVYSIRDKYQGAINSANPNFYLMASSAHFADGEVLTFAYDSYTDPFGFKHHRPASVTSSLGYRLEITYRSNVGGTGLWGAVDVARIVQVSNPGMALASLTYTDTTITDIDNRVYSCTGCGNRLSTPVNTSATSQTLPGETVETYDADAVVANHGNGYTHGRFTTDVEVDGVAFDYAYVQAGQTPGGPNQDKIEQLTITAPDGFSRVIEVENTQDFSLSRVSSVTNSLNQLTTYGYNGGTFLQLTDITYPEGNSVKVTYDGPVNITEIRRIAKPGSDPSSPTGRLPDIVETASYEYPPGGQDECLDDVTCYLPVWTSDAKGNRTDYTWGNHGGLLTQLAPADENGIRAKTINTYDANDRLIRTELCEANSAGVELTCGTGSSFVQEFTYFEATRLQETVTVLDGAGNNPLTTTYTYDAAGRKTSIDGPLPGSDDASYARYDVLGRMTWEIGPKGEDGYRPATRTYYRVADDQVDRVVTGYVNGTTSANFPAPPTEPSFAGIISDTETEFNSRRLAIRTTVSDDAGNAQSVSQMSFDSLNRSSCSAVRLDLTNIPADACVAATPVGAFGEDRITRQHYDTESRVVRIEQGVDTALVRDYATYTFTDNGQMASMTDARGYRAEMQYDGFDRQIYWYFPMENQTGVYNPNDYEYYEYDKNGNRTMLQKRDGSQITYQYDNLNRVISKTIPDNRPELQPDHTRDVFYDYDIRGLQLHARFGSDSGVGTSSVYDMYGRMTSVTDNTSGTSRTLESQYLADGSRWELKFPDNQAFRYYYWPGGQFNHMTGPQGDLLVDYNYSHRGELEEVIRDAAAPKQLWTFDDIGRMQTTTIDQPSAATFDVTWTYSRNPASQIASESQTNDSYSWDGFTAVDRPYVTNGLNQYTSVSGQDYCYDKNGNLTLDGDYIYIYDVENRLVEMRAIANTDCLNLQYTGQIKAELRYDPMGRLYEVENFVGGVSQGKRIMLYDGDALVAEYNASGTMLARYIHGPLQGVDDPIAEYGGANIAAADRINLYTDARGSIALRGAANGGTHSINSYDEFGQPSASNLGAFQYTGQVWLPELGMYYYKARIYSPVLGRFMQTDPIGYEDNVNLYGYVGQDPINYVDGTGNARKSIVGQAIRSAGRLSRGERPLQRRDIADILTDSNIILSTVRDGIELYNILTNEEATDKDEIDLTDPDSVRGQDPDDIAEAAKEAGLEESPSNNGTGRRFLDEKGNNGIRVQEGGGNRTGEDADIKEGGPYAHIVGGANAGAVVPLKGNAVLENEIKDD